MQNNNSLNLNKNLVRKHFNRHARDYDKYAGIQAYMCSKLVALMEHNVPSVTRILEIGCGTGRLTESLLRLYPNAAYTAIDLSEAMIDKARERLGPDALRVAFIAGDAESIAAEWTHTYDLIVSNAAFQWFNHPEETLRYFLNCLAPNGRLGFTTFGPRTFYELHASFYAAETLLGIEHKAHGQSFLDGEAWRGIFQGKTYDEGRTQWLWEEEKKEVAYPSVDEFLYAVKRVGAGNANGSSVSSSSDSTSSPSPSRSSRSSGSTNGTNAPSSLSTRNSLIGSPNALGTTSVSTPAEMENKAAGGNGGRKLFSAMKQFYAKHYGTCDGIKVTYDIGMGLYTTK